MAEADPFANRFRTPRENLVPSHEKEGESLRVDQLEGGEWSIEYGALISSITAAENPLERALKLRVNFFEGKPESVDLPRDEVLQVIRHWSVD